MSKRIPSFKFEAWWADDPEAREVVDANWKENGASCCEVWEKNLKRCSLALKNWSKKKFPRCNKVEISKCLFELDELQCRPTLDCSGRQEEIMTKLGALWIREEKHWQQRSRVKWLKEGDSNTRFFHLSTLQRRQRNRLLRIQDEEGNWLEGETLVRKGFENYFKGIFSSNGRRSWDNVFEGVREVVSSEMNTELTKPVTLEEVQSAASQLGALKAPGPDGFPGLFYHKYWSIVKDVIGGTTSEFMKGKTRLSHLNRTHIVLIPKVPNPEITSHFRPISLCNNSYKILSKILANRLKDLLPSLISSNQNAFVPGRIIQDNIMVAHEAFHYLKLLRGGGEKHELGLKLDMNKAYDRVEWDFVEAALYRFGFCKRWVVLIMMCITSVSFSVVINGKAGPFFKPRRGLRQGDPLSPYLFLIVSEVLSLRITRAVRDNRINGIKLGRGGPVISHLFFADDSLFFLKATLINAWNLKIIFDEYCKASGQLINQDKSCIYFSPNTPLQMQLLLSHLLGIGAVENPGNYLGLPSLWGRSKKEALCFIKDRVKKMVCDWKGKDLAGAGKEVKIKAVILATPSYPMSCFAFPKAVCNELNSIMGNFWWGDSEQGSKMHWKSWSYLGLPKSSGGMGFRDLYHFNLALLAKQCWRLITNPESLWATVIRARYFPDGDFFSAKKGYRASWGRSSLLAARDTILLGVAKQVTNGTNTGIWNDRWLPPSFDVIEPVRPVVRDLPMKVSELIVDGRWNLNKLDGMVSPGVISHILAIPVGGRDDEDRFIWPVNKDGMYTVRSGYHWWHQKVSIVPTPKQGSSMVIEEEVWKLIWKTHTLPKIRHFLWKVLCGAAPTMLSLFRRKLATDPRCPICLEHEESFEHILFLCPWVEPVWFGSPLGLRISRQGVTNIPNFLQNFIRVFSRKEDLSWACTILSFFFWAIWKARCAFVFQQTTPCPFYTINSALRLLNEFLAANAKPVCSLRGTVGASWKPPPPNFFKINCDANWLPSNRGGLGVVIRNSAGNCVGGGSEVEMCASVVIAEARAILLGLTIAEEVGLKQVIVESDSKSVVDALKSVSRGCWEVYTIIKEIRRRSSCFEKIQWEWCSRKVNVAAHIAATLANGGVGRLRWATMPPPALTMVLRNDGLPCPPGPAA